MSVRVAVVIPTIRFDSHLLEAVSSTLTNGYEHVEVVVVADGVADPTPVGLLDPRVKVVQLPRRSGTPTALNRGLAATQAEFVARLDADDLALHGRFARQVAALDADQELCAVATAAVLIDEDGRTIGRLGEGMAARGVRAALVRRNPIVHSSVMYRREEIIGLGGYAVDCLRMQDYELFLRVSLAGGGIEILPEPLTAYRLHEAQHSRTSPPRGPGYRAIQRRRTYLARELGYSSVFRLANRVAWAGAQWSRHLGLRNPRYVRGIQ